MIRIATHYHVTFVQNHQLNGAITGMNADFEWNRWFPTHFREMSSYVSVAFRVTKVNVAASRTFELMKCNKWLLTRLRALYVILILLD